MLAGGALPLSDIARHTGLTQDAARRLLKGAAALKLIEARAGDRFGLGAQGAALLGNPGLAMMIEHHAMLYEDLRDPVALLRGEQQATSIGALWPYAESPRPGELPREATASYTALMAATQQMVADEILAAYLFRRHRRVMDVGGGNGAFLAAVASAAPKLDLMLFDLPSVAESAQSRFETAGIAGRATIVGGNFLHDPLPTGADLITLVRVIHDHDDDAVLAILAAAHRALPPGGALLIGEPMAETPGAEPVGDAYFGFYLLAMGSGRPRSAASLEGLLRRAGFARVRLHRTRNPFIASVIVANR